jgi:hypothetical protein
VGKHSVTKLLIRQGCKHRRLYRRHDLACIGADHCEAENAIVISADQDFHETLRLVGRFSSQDSTHRQFSDAYGNAMSLCVPFA